MLSLTGQIEALHRALADAGLAHAFGGALALAFCTADPRGTRDIDVNVFIAPDQVATLEAALPPGIVVTDSNRRQLVDQGQSRLWWHETPVDVFLANHPFHDQVEQNRRFVAFAGVPRLPVLACTDLAVFKAFVARAKHAIDVAAMALAGTTDVAWLEREVARLLGDEHDRAEFFALVRRAVADGRR